MQVAKRKLSSPLNVQKMFRYFLGFCIVSWTCYCSCAWSWKVIGGLITDASMQEFWVLVIEYSKQIRCHLLKTADYFHWKQQGVSFFMLERVQMKKWWSGVQSVPFTCVALLEHSSSSYEYSSSCLAPCLKWQSIKYQKICYYKWKSLKYQDFKQLEVIFVFCTFLPVITRWDVTWHWLNL